MALKWHRSNSSFSTLLSNVYSSTKINKVNFRYLTKLSSDNFYDNDEPNILQLKCLKERFGLDNFKAFQWKTINQALNSRDSYVCLPSGYGKSLCYQFPAVYSQGLSVVVSPLISLMEDQVRLLEKIKIPSCYLASTKTDKNLIIDSLFNGEYNVLYITPESAFTAYGLDLLQCLYMKRAITLFAIDEAHCIPNWGKDFRINYQKLDFLRNLYPTVPIMALTATASNKQKDYIIETLKLKDPLVICEGFDRPNLFFMAKPTTNDEIEDIKNSIKLFQRKFGKDYGSIIIYCLTIRMSEKIAKYLKSVNLSCQVYHSNLHRDERKEALHNFMNNKFKIMVATTAFGMGINKPDIRMIIHYGTSLNMEGYYQEVGRAGRDGKPSLCILFYSPLDFNTHRYLTGLHSKSHETFQNNKESNDIMKRYISLDSCRRKFILSHFDSKFDSIGGDNCCDNCSNIQPQSKYECSFETELFLKAIHSFLPQKYGIKMIVSMLMGVKHKKVAELCKNNKYYGLGINRDENWWRHLALYLETEKFIRISAKIDNKIMYSKAIVDEKGINWLNNKRNGIASPIYLKYVTQIS